LFYSISRLRPGAIQFNSFYLFRHSCFATAFLDCSGIHAEDLRFLIFFGLYPIPGDLGQNPETIRKSQINNFLSHILVVFLIYAYFLILLTKIITDFS